MNLIIQIPCLNEAQSLPTTVAALPRQVEGFDKVELMVIDDGSTDGTVAVARALGVDYIVELNGHQGLARAFMAGLLAAHEHGADVIVNTDADNQYSAGSLAALVRPILEDRADLVIGARPLWATRHFSAIKRILQVLGSRVVSTLSGAEVRDAASGFRAMNRHAALRLNVFGDFTYTIETVIQAGLNHLRIVSVPITVNDQMRPSRLFRSNGYYVWRSLLTMLGVYLIYRPTRIFGTLAVAFLVPGFALGIRSLIHAMAGEGVGPIHSLITCSILMLSGLFIAVMGILAHLLRINRQLLEEIRQLLRTQRAHNTDATSRHPDSIANGICRR
jgi:glycosyltransferase involved in cell wall biosynthesis